MAAISYIVPAVFQVGDRLKIAGSGFGASQGAGGVTVDGQAVTLVYSWADTLVEIAVPAGVSSGQEVDVVLSPDTGLPDTSQVFACSLYGVEDPDFNTTLPNHLETAFEAPASRTAPQATIHNRLLEQIGLLHEEVGGRTHQLVTSITTLNDDTDVVIFDATGGNRLVTIPNASGHTDRRVALYKKDSALFTASIVVNGGLETFYVKGDGASNSHALRQQGDFLVLESDGTEWRVIKDGIRPLKCSVSLDTNQAIPASSETPIVFTDFEDGVSYMFSGGNLTTPRDGVYILQGFCRLENLANNTAHNAWIEVNGVKVDEMYNAGIGAGSEATFHLRKKYQLAAADVVRIVVEQGDTVSRDVTGSLDENRALIQIEEIR